MLFLKGIKISIRSIHMKREKLGKKYFLLLLIIVLINICGLNDLFGKKRYRSFLLTDKLVSKNYDIESLLLWRVIIIDHTGYFKKSSPDLGLIYADSNPSNDNNIIHTNGFPPNWEKKNGVYYYNMLYAHSLKSGYFKINHLKLCEFISKFSSLRLNINYIKKCNNTFNLESWSQTSNTLMYLGTFYIEISRLSKTGDGYIYKAILSQGEEEYKRDISEFKKKYPKIYEPFKNRLKKVSFHIYYNSFPKHMSRFVLNMTQDLSSEFDIPSLEFPIKKKDRRFKHYYSRRGYLMNSMTNAVCILLKKFPKVLPQKCTITIESMWKSGNKQHPYGFLLGTNKNKLNAFVISAEGKTAVTSFPNNKFPKENFIEWVSAPTFYLKKKSINKQTIIVNHNEYSYYVNGQLIKKIKKYDDKNNSVLGLLVSGIQSVVIKRLVIE